MHWNDYLALVGFSTAPGTLPDNATTAFSAAGFCLILADIVMLLKRRRAAAGHPAP